MGVELKIQPNASPQPTRRDYTTDFWCWFSYCEDLIYAAGYAKSAPGAYLAQIERRKPLVTDKGRERAMRYGAELHATLVELFPDARTGLELSQLACGDGLQQHFRMQRFLATHARCSAYLPPKPPTPGEVEQSERGRRSGITEEQRQRNAEEWAGAL